jgi:hypothetical protein
MPAKITPLPGKRCALYVAGRCLLQERRNPGLRQEWRCKVLVAWENEYEKFLTQADNFQLDEQLSVKIWRQRMEAILSSQPVCPNYRPSWRNIEDGEPPTIPSPAEVGGFFGGLDMSQEDAEIACADSWVGLCLHALPVCEGVCQWYEERR